MNPADFILSIREEYNVVDGIIRNPGQFECECEWVPYYWELALNGDGDDLSDYDESGEIVGGIVSRFVVDSEEADAFGLYCGATVEIFQDSQGFVMGTVME